MVLAAACGGEHRIVLELAGNAPGADRVSVVLLHPRVLARQQRHNDSQRNGPGMTTLETVFYMAERASTEIPLAGAPTDGFQLEIRDTDGPYVPLVVVRSADRVLAMGIYNPESVFSAKLDEEHDPAPVKPVRDVTIYTIELEQVVKRFAAANTDPPMPPQVRPAEVMEVPCGPDAM